MAHVGQYVLVNMNTEFKDFSSGPADENGVYDKKKGRDFYASKDGQGNTSALGFKGPSAICADGAPKAVAGDTYQPTTSFQFTDGSQVNADKVPYVVLPRTKNAAGDWASPDRVSGNPFNNAGVQRGDYVLVRNPQNGKSVYAIYGENGPSGQVGEISIAAARALGINPSPTKGGFTNMTDSQYLQYEIYPGSGKTSPNGSRIEKQSAAEIQKNGKAAAEARGAGGGYPITSGAQSVFVGTQQQPAAFADPLCIHTGTTGSCPIIEGSDSVFLEKRPATRVGDACSCGQRVITGEPTVQIYGSPTSQGTSLSGDAPISLWDAKPAAPSAFSLTDPSSGVSRAAGAGGAGGLSKPPTGTKALQQAGNNAYKKK
jgi:uncharacterized Zn-binding protein involved in type VI secretion